MYRRIAIVLTLALLLVVSACGGGGGEPTGDAKGPGETDAATSEQSGRFPRTVVHAMGETEIRQRPKRVVVLDTGELDSTVTLDVVPVGAVRAPVEDGFLDYLQDQTGDTKLVGTISDVLTGSATCRGMLHRGGF